MKTSIALIGFMGTGKTGVGKALAEKLGKEFFELDPLIEKKAGKTIPAIFKEDGEIAFREFEIEAIKEVSKERNAVIACGGRCCLKQNKHRPAKKGSGNRLPHCITPGNTRADIKRCRGEAASYRS